MEVLIAVGGTVVVLGAPVLPLSLLALLRKRGKRIEDIPTTLPGIMGSPALDGGFAVVLLQLHLGCARLEPQWVGKDLGVCAKYGEAGESVKCRTATSKVRLGRPAGASFTGRSFGAGGGLLSQQGKYGEAEFSTDCLFLGDPDRAPVVRLRLFERTRLGARTVAKGCLKVPFNLEGCDHTLDVTQQTTVTLQGTDPRGDPVGCLEVTVRACTVPLSDARQLIPTLGFRQQRDAFVMESIPVAMGRVCPSSGPDPDAAEPPIVGLPLTEASSRKQTSARCLLSRP